MVDRLDRGILHCLMLDGRVAFRRAAEVLGVSEQTVARRYRRLRGDGVVRVVGLVDLGQPAHTIWQLRIKARSDHVVSLAAALAAREDVSWVTIGSGGTEVLASLRAPDAADRDDLLLRRLPGSARVLDMTAVAVLHRFPPPDGADFRVPSDLATPAAFATLLAPRPGLSPDAPRLLPADQPLLQALAADGRASAAELGRATGWGEARAGQRLRTLLASGRVYIDTDAALEALDYRSSAHLWLTVEPRTLRSNGEALAGHPDVAFVGAITGTANLLVSVILTDPAALYAFLAEPLGRLDGVRQVEVAPVLRWVKQAGTLVEGARLKL